MDLETQIELRVGSEVKKRGLKIFSKNAVSALLNFFPPGKALFELIEGEKNTIEIEKMKIMLTEIIIAFDQQTKGKEIGLNDKKTTIMLENIIAKGSVRGLRASTSSPELQKILERPLDVKLRNIRSDADIIGVDLNVDKELKLKKTLNIEVDSGKVKINPELGDITFGKEMN